MSGHEATREFKYSLIKISAIVLKTNHQQKRTPSILKVTRTKGCELQPELQRLLFKKYNLIVYIPPYLVSVIFMPKLYS